MPSDLVTRALLEISALAARAPGIATGLRGMGSILMLHRVAKTLPPATSPHQGLTVTVDHLDALLGGLKRRGYEFLSMDAVADLLEAPERGNPDKPFIALTLDDGYRDNLLNAVPVFKKHDVPYCIFVAPGLVDGRATIWWEDLENIIASQSAIDVEVGGTALRFGLGSSDQKQAAFQAIFTALANEVSERTQRSIMATLAVRYGYDAEAHRAASIMNWEELAQLQADALCTIGAHTIHHYAVARLDAEEARAEMQQSAQEIADRIGVMANHFAYPYGMPSAAGARDFQLAEEVGFRTAVTTRHGVVYREHAAQMLALPRISVNGRFQKLRYGAAMVSGITTRLANKGRRLNVL